MKYEKIGKGLLILAISMVLFYTVHVPLTMNLIVLGAVNLFCLLRYHSKLNRKFYEMVLVVQISVESAYVLEHVLCRRAYLRVLDRNERVLFAICAIEFVVILYKIRANFYGIKHPIEKDKAQDSRSPDLFKERQYDLQRIEEFLERVNILGVNASWGTGKTFLIDRLCKKVEGQYEIIRLEVLVNRLGELQPTLIHELDSVLRRNGIFSSGSKRLRKLLQDNKYLTSVGNIFSDADDTISASYRGLKEDVEKLDKSVLIIFDDIDRVQDAEAVRTMLATAESLACKKIKILILYDEYNLKTLLKLSLAQTHTYMEKYIPYVVKLTHIPFSALVGYFWKELEMESTGYSQFDVAHMLEADYRNISLNHIVGKDMWFMFKDIPISVRKVKLFLSELRQYARNQAFQNSDMNREILLGILCIKHFLYELYEQFSTRESIAESIKFRTGNESVSIWQILLTAQGMDREERYEYIRNLLTTAGNQNIACALMMFPYHYDLYHQDIDGAEMEQEDVSPWRSDKKKTVEERRRQRATLSEDFLRKQEENEKIDRIVWNIIANGASEYTDQEVFVKLITEEVLCKQGKERKEAWNRLKEKAYYQDLWKNNKTLFVMGIDDFLPVFQAFRMAGAKPVAVKQFVEFYFDMEGEKGITVEMVENLSYIDLNDRDVYMMVLRRFCETKIVGNLGNEPGWRRFRKGCLAAIYNLGYCRNAIFESLTWDYETIDMENAYGGMSASLESRKAEITLPSFVAEIDQIIMFIEHCMMIMGDNKHIQAKVSKLDIRESSRWTHQDEVNRLLQVLEDSPNTFDSEVEKSYNEKKIHPMELEFLLGEKKEKRGDKQK